jgi:hypothetical protein
VRNDGAKQLRAYVRAVRKHGQEANRGTAASIQRAPNRPLPLRNHHAVASTRVQPAVMSPLERQRYSSL